MLAAKSNSYTFNKDGIWYFSRRVPADLKRHYRTGRISYSPCGSQPALIKPSIKTSAKVEFGTKIRL